jgi:low affinity Fe/Cu permease
MEIQEGFRKICSKTSDIIGSPVSFVCAFLMILVWALIGPYFKWSEGHSLFINTATTIVTYLLIFLLQNSQNRSTKEIELRLDELIRSQKDARNNFINLGALTDKQIKELQEDIKRHVSAHAAKK